MPLVSIIIPIYNVQDYLKRCLNSVVSQTLNDIEIILIDDGSTDKGYDICKSYAEKDSRILVYKKGNKGVASARNLGISVAKGEYIGFVDPDDYIDLDMFKFLYDTCIDHNVKVSCCLEYGKAFEKKSRTVGTNLIPSDKYFAQTMKDCSFALWNKLWHRSLFENFVFPEEVESGSDLFSYKLLLKCDLVADTHISKYHYTIRKNSLSRMLNIDNRMQRHETISRMICDLQNINPDLVEYGILLRYKTRKNTIRQLLSISHFKYYKHEITLLKQDYIRCERLLSLYERLSFLILKIKCKSLCIN